MAKTVLVVDDDPTQRRLLQAVLERDGYAVVHAVNGGEAIDRMTKGGGADVILLDMIMPEMSGMECLAEMRSAGVTTPVIVLTANGASTPWSRPCRRAPRTSSSSRSARSGC